MNYNKTLLQPIKTVKPVPGHLRTKSITRPYLNSRRSYTRSSFWNVLQKHRKQTCLKRCPCRSRTVAIPEVVKKHNKPATTLLNTFNGTDRQVSKPSANLDTPGARSSKNTIIIILFNYFLPHPSQTRAIKTKTRGEKNLRR